MYDERDKSHACNDAKHDKCGGKVHVYKRPGNKTSIVDGLIVDGSNFVESLCDCYCHKW